VAPPAEALFDLTGRRALVTGASRGLGRTISSALGRHGARVFGVSRNAAALDAALGQLRDDGVQADGAAFDLADEHAAAEAVEQAVAAMGGLDILVNNAGTHGESPVLSTPTAVWDGVVAVNLRAPFLLCRAAAPHLMDGGGKVVNVLSILSTVAVKDTAAYIASKSGLAGFTRALALEWARSGVQVNGLAPGFMRTEMNEALWGTDSGYDWGVRRTPMGRWGEAEDVAGAAVFLASRASDFMTGQTVVVDGGWTAQ